MTAKSEVMRDVESAAASLARAVEDVTALLGKLKADGPKAGNEPAPRALFASGIKYARKSEMSLRAARKAVDEAAGG